MPRQKRKPSNTSGTPDIPPAKKQKISDVDPELKKATKAGYDAAYRNFTRPTREKLMQRNHYSEELVIAYLKSYDDYMNKHKNDDQQATRKARRVAYDDARHGSLQPTLEKLIFKKNFSEVQAITYLKHFEKQVEDLDQQSIKRAQTAGTQAAHINSPRPTPEELIQRNHYSEAQVAAYLDSFDRKKLKMEKIKLTKKANDSPIRPDLNKTSSNHINEQISSHTFTRHTEKFDATLSTSQFDEPKNNDFIPGPFDVLNKAEEDNFFVPGLFDTLTNPGKVHASHQITPLLFNYSTKTDLEPNSCSVLEKAEGVFNLLEPDQFVTISKPF